MDIALQITRRGFTYAMGPETGNGKDVIGIYVRWANYGRAGDRIYEYQSMLVQRAIARVLVNSAAHAVVLAIEDGTSQRRIDATWAALNKENCVVSERRPHSDGAIGLIREELGETFHGDGHSPTAKPARFRMQK